MAWYGNGCVQPPTCEPPTLTRGPGASSNPEDLSSFSGGFHDGAPTVQKTTCQLVTSDHKRSIVGSTILEPCLHGKNLVASPLSDVDVGFLSVFLGLIIR